MEPHIYQVRRDQVGDDDISDFLRKAIARQFEGKDYYIANEQIMDRAVSYSQGKIRRIRSFLIQENTTNTQHSLFFDVTDATDTSYWGSR